MRSLNVIASLFVSASTLQRRRAFLTVAAIAWGTVAILMLMAFGEGLQRQLLKGKRGMGENIAVWWPGETTKVWEGLSQGRRIRPTMDDLDYLRGRMETATGVIGEITSWQTSLTWGTTTVSNRVTGVNWEYGEMRHHYPQSGGRFLNARDEAEKRRVIFLGDELARNLFGEHDPVGETLMVARTPYLVVGVMQPKLQMGTYKGPDEGNAVVPISTFAAQFGTRRLSNVVFKVARPEEMRQARWEFDHALADRFRFDPTDTAVTDLWDTVEGAKFMDNFTMGLKVFFGVVGALTLLIGGVGVANIMYAVVKERTREIGVQMALGAHRSWVTWPFILQGLAYTLLGGMVGIVIATVIVLALSFVPVEGNDALEFLGKPTLSIQIAVITAGILGLIGVAAGYFPARRAAGVDPAQTLRYE